MTELEWRIERRPGSLLAHLRGEIDRSNSGVLAQLLAELGREKRVVLDFSGVRNVDSTGYGQLVGAADRLATAGGAMALARPRPNVAEVLRLLGLEAFFRILPDLEESLVAFESERSQAAALPPSLAPVYGAPPRPGPRTGGAPGTLVECPGCRRAVRPDESRCPFCGREVETRRHGVSSSVPPDPPPR